MRMRLLAIVSALLVAIVVFPLAASAQSQNTARLSATSYTDTAGSESDPLCDSESIEGTIIEAIVSYSGVGDQLGGSGTGDLLINVFGSGFSFSGELEIDGEPAFIEGGGSAFCLTSGYALVFGEFFASGAEELPNGPVGPFAIEPGETVCGSVFGTIQDGAHPNQGRVSLTLSASDETECLLG